MGNPFKLKNGTILLSTEAPGGIYNAMQLKKIAALCDQDAAIVKATEDQRLALFVKEDQKDKIAKELKQTGLGIRHYQDGLHQPTTCIGELCPEYKQDALGVAVKISEELAPLNTKSPLKIGINGCANCCVPCHTMDIAIIGEEDGYRLSLGGKNSQIPEMASFAAEAIPEEELPGFLFKIVEQYNKDANQGDTLQEVLERKGSTAYIALLAPYSRDAVGGDLSFALPETKFTGEIEDIENMEESIPLDEEAFSVNEESESMEMLSEEAVSEEPDMMDSMEMEEPVEEMEDVGGMEEPVEEMEDVGGMEEPVEEMEDVGGMEEPVEEMEDVGGMEEPVEEMEVVAEEEVEVVAEEEVEEIPVLAETEEESEENTFVLDTLDDETNEEHHATIDTDSTTQGFDEGSLEQGEDLTLEEDLPLDDETPEEKSLDDGEEASEEVENELEEQISEDLADAEEVMVDDTQAKNRDEALRMMETSQMQDEPDEQLQADFDPIEEMEIIPDDDEEELLDASEIASIDENDVPPSQKNSAAAFFADQGPFALKGMDLNENGDIQLTFQAGMVLSITPNSIKKEAKVINLGKNKVTMLRDKKGDIEVTLDEGVTLKIPA